MLIDRRDRPGDGGRGLSVTRTARSMFASDPLTRHTSASPTRASRLSGQNGFKSNAIHPMATKEVSSS